LGLIGMSNVQVAEMANALDEVAASFRTRPLEQGPYTPAVGSTPSGSVAWKTSWR
jgi:hypothetical protein